MTTLEDLYYNKDPQYEDDDYCSIVKQNKMRMLESSLEESVYRLASNGDHFHVR